ncbi:MAG: rRNA adenine N-6-methyltransferase family protein, partial [Candidatus Aenigmatarchaeota archaeon]
MNVVDILKRYSIEPSRYRDQYFLTDGNILSKEVEYAGVNKEDVVLEIGSGIGNLTEKLASKAKRVIAVEKDSRFCEVLSDRNISNIRIIQGDILDIDVPDFDKVVSNVPY